MFRGDAVLDRYHRASAPLSKQRAEPLIVRAAHEITATVQPEQAGPWRASFTVPENEQVQRAILSINYHFLGLG